MNRVRLVGVVVALAIGLLASYYVYRQVQKVSAAPVEMGQVVVAAADLRLGTRLEAHDLRLIPWPQNVQLAGAFTKVEDCVNRALITSVAENEPILQDKLAPIQAGAGLPAAIPEGMRAVSVRVDDVVAVAGFVTPGTMVDVLVTGNPQGNNAESVTRTILENIRVIAAGQKVEKDKEGKPQTYSVVTLLVTPTQANDLTMGSTDGKIHLSLRNILDTKEVHAPVVFRTALLLGGASSAPRGVSKRTGASPKAKAQPAPPQVYSVEVIRGEKRETQNFPAHTVN